MEARVCLSLVHITKDIWVYTLICIRLSLCIEYTTLEILLSHLTCLFEKILFFVLYLACLLKSRVIGCKIENENSFAQPSLCSLTPGPFPITTLRNSKFFKMNENDQNSPPSTDSTISFLNSRNSFPNSYRVDQNPVYLDRKLHPHIRIPAGDVLRDRGTRIIACSAITTLSTRRFEARDVIQGRR